MRACAPIWGGAGKAPLGEILGVYMNAKSRVLFSHFGLFKAPFCADFDPLLGFFNAVLWFRNPLLIRPSINIAHRRGGGEASNDAA